MCGLGTVISLGGAGTGDLSKQRPTYHIDYIPPAPVLSPEDELKSFRLPAGFHAELVASEPMVEEPIAITFDPDGRMYVVELRGYMPDIDGHGELDPVGQIVRLESTHRDGKYDRKTIFLDGLVAPRTVSLAGDGVIVAEPPNLLFCRDTKGTGKCDQKTIIATDYGSKRANPEHMANACVRMLDNWYYSADFSLRYRFNKGAFTRSSTVSRGQWGITQDDVGRLFYNANPTMMRCDQYPAAYLTRNPYLRSPAGINVQVASNATHPCRVNPGVNRGYGPDCDANGKLQRVTAACGPAIYRADQFPEEYRGNAFACDPAGNLVASIQIHQTEAGLAGTTLLHDGVDFFCSMDERFRPVNLTVGPDGALYVVDLYHGIVQHGAYISAYLADQIKQRNLAENGGHRGRIWRIVADGAKPVAMPALSKGSTDDLIAALSSSNGWHRDTAQRLLVERNDGKSAIKLAQLATNAKVPAMARIHALWTLEGMERIEDDTCAEAATDADARVRVAALRAGEILIHKRTAPRTTALLPKLANDSSTEVQFQVLATCSADLPELTPIGNGILSRHLNDPVFRAAAISSAAGRELELAESLLTMKEFESASDESRHELLVELSECVMAGRVAKRIDEWLSQIAKYSEKPAYQEAMMSGVVNALIPKTSAKTAPAHRRPLRLPAEPPAIALLLASSDTKVAKMMEKAQAVISWPNKAGDTLPPLALLSADQQKRFEGGQLLFTQICAQCHQPTGLGQDGIAPPLVDSEWVLGTPHRLTRIVLNGLRGPVKIGKKTMDLEMPGLGALTDEQISSVLTYIRREWGHEASPVDPKAVTDIRKETAVRGEIEWSADELSKIK